MRLDYQVYDEIVDADLWGGISPQAFIEATEELKEGDELTLHFNSPGGSVVAGIAIANRLKDLSKKGVKTTAIVEGICASIATVMMCACDTVKMNKSAFVMIHNCWAVVQGDADELRKQADVMEKMNEAILSFYRSKFDLTDDELKSYMDEETWFSGMEAKDFKFNCEVLDDESEVRLAAKFDLTKFHKLPEVLSMTKKEEQADDIKKEDEVVVEDKAEEVVAEPTNEEPKKKPDEGENPPVEEESEEEQSEEEEPQDEKKEDDDDDEEEEEEDVEALKARIAELEAQLAECQKEKEEKDTISKDECEKRVSGMQASMQKQVNDFKGQLELKDKELINAKAEITSLNQKLEESVRELSEKTSALMEKEEALAKLNANVNAHADELPTMNDGLAKCATPAEKVAFLKSGKYVR